MPEKTIKELEKEFEQLHERLLRGEMEEDEFKAEVEQLRFKDDLGRQWKIGWFTGKWYRDDGGQWVQGAPLERNMVDDAPAPSPTPAEEGQRRRPIAYWLVAALVILSLGASVILIIGWNTGWWSEAPTEIADATATQSASPTSAPASPTLKPSAVAPSPTPLAPSPSPQPEATEKPTATATATTAPATVTNPTASSVPTQTEPTSTAATTRPAQASLSGRIFFPVYDPARRAYDIHAIQLDSGKREVVINQASQPALSPNGQRLAYRSWARDQRSISVLELADGHAWRWIEFAEAARPSWSPDSENIVFPSRQESDRQWRVYRTLGLEFIMIRRHGGDILGRVPTWLADGRIVYWDCPLNKCGLYIMKSDGTNPNQLTTAEHDTGPAASPDGKQVAFMSNRNGNWEIYIVNTDPSTGGEATRLTENAARDGLPTWSPDGKWLAFASDRGGGWAVWAIRPNGSGLRKLFELGGPLEGEVAFAQPDEQDDWTSETIAWGP